ncbi:MAG TPA: hypothetical protein VNG29_03400 [Candidatus Paceibacterota bacterium]|nr:hypothetical protein [Candidatus Paceibacterota bacterium]
MKKIFIGVAAVVIAAVILIFAFQRAEGPVAPTTPPAASGTVPGASSTVPSPTPSPTPSAKGTVQGQVLLGPICPVERIPPDPNCAPRPYQAAIRVQPADPSAPSLTIQSDASGSFSVSLDPGTYTFHAQNANSSYYPRCEDAQVRVVAGAAQTVTINCDTGIR